MNEEASNSHLKPNFNIMELFENKEIVKICAPMVRYSKLQFRNLVKIYGCDLCFTPMILADSFCKSAKARNNEFTTNLNDDQLIAQFAANTVHDFVGAAHLISPFCNGVDLNCGCPQRWAKQKGLGCVMLENPDSIHDLIRQCRNTILKPFTVSVKMRLLKDVKRSVEICKQLEHCGVSFLTVHARTPDQLTGDINRDALKLIVENLDIPVVGNGGITTLEGCLELQNATKCQGVMVANGLLTNPTLFTGATTTTGDCIQKWVDICYNTTLSFRDCNAIRAIPEKPNNLTFQCFHHHLVFMLEKVLSKKEKRIFNNLQTFEDVLCFVKNRFDIEPRLFNEDHFKDTSLLDVNYSDRDNVYLNLKPNIKEVDNFLYSYDNDGKHFINKTRNECDWSDLFLELE